jgi:hypothetical protein
MISLALRRLLFSVFAIALLLVATKPANACSCGPRPTVLDEFEGSDEVVIVKALSVEKAGDKEGERYVNGIKSTTLVVEKVFKGRLKVRDEIILGQGGGADCVWTFSEQAVGSQFLFYLERPEKRSFPVVRPDGAGLWFAFTCGRVSELEDAAEDLLYLENLSKVRGKTRISGSLRCDYPQLDLEGIKIKIVGPKKTYQTETDKDGVFEIYDLPPGKYVIEPETPAGWKVDPSWFRYSASIIGSDIRNPEIPLPKQAAVMLESKKHASVYIVITIDNYVRGRVLDSTGQGLNNVCVSLLRPGQDEWGPVGCTDEQGAFKITEVPEGEYVLVANPYGKPSSSQPFPKIFYPSATEREHATVLNIGLGENVSNLDIIIPKLEETVTVAGVLRYSDGKPVAEHNVKFEVTKRDEKVNGNVTEKTDKDGRFTLTVLKGLTGELTANEFLFKDRFKNCPKVDELIAKGGNYLTVYSNVVKLTTEQNVYEVELTLPIPQCEKVN